MSALICHSMLSPVCRPATHAAGCGVALLHRLLSHRRRLGVVQQAVKLSGIVNGASHPSAAKLTLGLQVSPAQGAGNCGFYTPQGPTSAGSPGGSLEQGFKAKLGAKLGAQLQLHWRHPCARVMRPTEAGAVVATNSPNRHRLHPCQGRTAWERAKQAVHQVELVTATEERQPADRESSGHRQPSWCLPRASKQGIIWGPPSAGTHCRDTLHLMMRRAQKGQFNS
jgi:hypothetical protein